MLPELLSRLEQNECVTFSRDPVVNALRFVVTKTFGSGERFSISRAVEVRKVEQSTWDLLAVELDDALRDIRES
jgi:hypothetical protein